MDADLDRRIHRWHADAVEWEHHHPQLDGRSVAVNHTRAVALMVEASELMGQLIDHITGEQS